MLFINDDRSLMQVLSQAGPGSAVKALLTLRNISQTELSIKLGISQSEISRVISGRRKTRRIRKAIAQELGVAPEILFGTPERPVVAAHGIGEGGEPSA